jgi:hypothetical protein
MQHSCFAPLPLRRITRFPSLGTIVLCPLGMQGVLAGPWRMTRRRPFRDKTFFPIIVHSNQ